MKTVGDMLLSPGPFEEIVIGNTALVRGMLETGARVATSYPGSPIPEIAMAIKAIPKEKRPFYFEFSTNEKVATEVAYGAAVNGHLATVFFKSVGLNVAADTFVQLPLMNIIGGMVVVLGDDPGANSSQNEQDNRHLARMCYMPVLEPADPAEVYHYYIKAAQLSRNRKMPVLLRLTTHVCHAKQKVTFGRLPKAAPHPPAQFDAQNGCYIPLTSDIFPLKRNAFENLDHAATFAQKENVTQTINHQNSARGIITAGLPFASVMDVLADTPAPPDILKLGMVYPLPKKTLINFLESHREVRLIEELDDLFEKEIKALAFDEGLAVKLVGKQNHAEWMGEYTPEKVRAVLYGTWPDLFDKEPAEAPVSQAPPRPAQMCPGCGHRSAFFAIKKALAERDITVADIGCHTLGYMPPYEMGQLMMCMGASTGIASGLSLYNTDRKVVAFLGDSTFFHAGLPGIINALFNNHPITLILMENGTTAMTGHQDHAASGRNFNDAVDKIPIRQVLKGLGVQQIYEVDTYQQARLTELVEKALADKGFSVVIARHPCMLKLMRQQRRKKGWGGRQVAIDQEVCERIHTCIEAFACPSFQRDDKGRITVNTDLCIGDGSCRQVCPTGAIEGPRKVNPELHR